MNQCICVHLPDAPAMMCTKLCVLVMLIMVAVSAVQQWYVCKRENFQSTGTEFFGDVAQKPIA